MESKRRALGKGLEQLFNSENLDFDKIETEIIESASTDEVVNVKLSELRTNPYQPRKVFDEAALEELAILIRENGVFQPIIVKKSIKGYEIIAGERRVKASRKVGLETIPAIIRDFSDEQMMQIALLENLQREDLNAIEEAEAYKAMLDSLHITQEELGAKLGKSRSHITNMLGILKLPKAVQELVLYGRISMGHARVLSKISDLDIVENLAKRTVDEDLSVRKLEELASENRNDKQSNSRRSSRRNKEYDYVEETLKEVLGTKVIVSKNKIQIDFSSSKDLNRILEILNIDINE